jgi:Arc/MetJ-type ribon-helix-helix transcriptional regulator
MSQRVVFTFDDNSLESLKQLRDKGAYTSMGTAVRDAVQLSEVLHEQAEDGFTDLVLRNPKTQQEKHLIVPALKRVARPTRAKAATSTLG